MTSRDSTDPVLQAAPGYFLRFPVFFLNNMKELGLKAFDILVAETIFSYWSTSDKNWECFPGLKTVAARLRVSDERITASLKRWDTTNYLPRYRKRVEGRLGHYYFNVRHIAAHLPAGEIGDSARRGDKIPGVRSPPFVDKPHQSAKRGMTDTLTNPQNADSLTPDPRVLRENHVHNNNTQSPAVEPTPVVVEMIASLKDAGVPHRWAMRWANENLEACRAELALLPLRCEPEGPGLIMQAIKNRIAGKPWLVSKKRLSSPAPIGHFDHQAAQEADEERCLPRLTEQEIEEARDKYKCLKNEEKREIERVATAALHQSCPALSKQSKEHPTRQRALFVLMTLKVDHFMARKAEHDAQEVLTPPGEAQESPPLGRATKLNRNNATPNVTTKDEGRENAIAAFLLEKQTQEESKSLEIAACLDNHVKGTGRVPPRLMALSKKKILLAKFYALPEPECRAIERVVTLPTEPHDLKDKETP